MEISDIIEGYRQTVIQIATPYSTGTGFYVAQYNLIVTNEHVVRDNKQVVIDGETFDKQLVDVIYLDPKYDLAFLSAPEGHKMTGLNIGSPVDLSEGDSVIAIGHPYGLKFGATQGIISNLLHKENDVHFIQHDAALNPGNSGGPLISTSGELVGINTFIIRDGNSIGFSLPLDYLLETFKEYRKEENLPAVRCNSCLNIVFEKDQKSKYCHNCGSKMKMIKDLHPYEPLGINKTIEEMLLALGHNVELSRRGPNNWEVRQGSAVISISYHEKTGLIIADAYLCLLPKHNLKPLYEFLLRENYSNQSLTFTVRNQDVILSILIYDQYLNAHTATELFKRLFLGADHYDDVLVNEYGALWKK